MCCSTPVPKRLDKNLYHWRIACAYSSDGPTTRHRFTLQPEHSPKTSPSRIAMQAALSAKERHTATEYLDKRAGFAPGP